MINNSVNTANKRRRASGPARIVPTGRASISRQVEPIFKDDDDDVEAVPPPPSPPPPAKVIRSTRRRSSVNRTRDSIMRILKDQKSSQTEPSRSNVVDTILSPVDWLMGPVDDNLPDENIHEAWEHKQELQSPRRWYIFLPHSKFRLTWDLFMAWLLSLMAFYIPFRVSSFHGYLQHFHTGLFF